MLNSQKVNVGTQLSRIPADSQVELVLSLPAWCTSTICISKIPIIQVIGCRPITKK